jgi:poly(3-hydroxybutyrate) depolymerase
MKPREAVLSVLLALALLAVPVCSPAQQVNAVQYTNVPYKAVTQSAQEKAACTLDIHVPTSRKNWPVLIHFHGGGMTGGDKDEGWTSDYGNWGPIFLKQGILLVMPNYRLIGKGGHWPNYIEDAAAAAAWVRKNIESYGGDPNSVFVGGFSAGAYLTHMLFLDATYLEGASTNAHTFAGFIPLSGQTTWHYNIISDIGKQFSVAKNMPMGFVRKTAVPYMILVGGNEGQTITDNKSLFDTLTQLGSTDISMETIPNQPHTTNDLGDATSPKRDNYFAFINKYKAKN